MGKRSYRQNCALARAADVIGERWTLLLIRDLIPGPRRYGELLRSLKGMGTNLLATRLKYLESDGIIERSEGDDGSSRYALTRAGRSLEPAVLELVRWGLAYGPENRSGDHHQDDWDLVALKALFDPARAGATDITVQFEGSTGPMWAQISNGELRVGRGSAEQWDVSLTGPVSVLRASSFDDMDGRDRRTLTDFVSCFAGVGG